MKDFPKDYDPVIHDLFIPILEQKPLTETEILERRRAFQNIILQDFQALKHTIDILLERFFRSPEHIDRIVIPTAYHLLQSSMERIPDRLHRYLLRAHEEYSRSRTKSRKKEQKHRWTKRRAAENPQDYYANNRNQLLSLSEWYQGWLSQKHLRGTGQFTLLEEISLDEAYMYRNPEVNNAFEHFGIYFIMRRIKRLERIQGKLFKQFIEEKERIAEIKKANYQKDRHGIKIKEQDLYLDLLLGIFFGRSTHVLSHERGDAIFQALYRYQQRGVHLRIRDQEQLEKGLEQLLRKDCSNSYIQSDVPQWEPIGDIPGAKIVLFTDHQKEALLNFLHDSVTEDPELFYSSQRNLGERHKREIGMVRHIVVSSQGGRTSYLNIQYTPTLCFWRDDFAAKDNHFHKELEDAHQVKSYLAAYPQYREVWENLGRLLSFNLKALLYPHHLS